MNKLALLSLSLICGCASPVVQMTDEARSVRVEKADPTDNYSLIGPVSASDGNGCGLFGRRGTYENAVTALRVRAASMDADWISIVSLVPPYLATPDCFWNPYVINGLAYQKVEEKRSAIPIEISKEPEEEGELVDRLKKLHELYEAGALTDDEYSRAKTRLLE